MTDYGYDREAALAHLRANLTRYTEEDYSLRDIGDDIQHHLVLPAPPSARTIKEFFTELGESGP